MPKDSLSAFIARHQFRLRDITPWQNGQVTSEDYALAQYFPDREKLFWFTGNDPYERLRVALLLAEHMSHDATDHPEGFSFFVSKLNDEAWEFALDFAPYHKVHVALSNLKTIHNAMVEAATRLNGALAGMTSAIEFSGFRTEQYGRERSVATSNLLNFSALYASYIDVCRRIKSQIGFNNPERYDRAIKRLIGKNSGQHKFIKDLRNFILHNELIEPECVLHHKFGESRTAMLVLDSSHLLRRGSKWSASAREFIQRDDKIDVISVVGVLVRDIARVIRFHQNLTKKHLPLQRAAYEHYLYERTRFKHLQASATDIGAVFKRPTSLVSRLIDKRTLELVLNSALANEDAKDALILLANRHKNLTETSLNRLQTELAKLMINRVPAIEVPRYLNGRKL